MDGAQHCSTADNERELLPLSDLPCPGLVRAGWRPGIPRLMALAEAAARQPGSQPPRAESWRADVRMCTRELP